MFKSKKVISMLLSLVLTTSVITTSAFASNISAKFDTGIENVITSYFDKYYNALETLEIQDMSNIVIDNDKMYIQKAALEVKIAGYAVADLSYKNTDISIKYDNVEIAEKEAKVSATVTCKFNYSNSQDILSTNIMPYEILLVNEDGWKICEIKSEHDDLLNNMEKDINASVNKNKLTGKSSINLIRDQWKTNILEAANHIEGGLQNPSEITESAATLESNSIMATYSYSPSVAVDYALRTAMSNHPHFYTASPDCTNYVSQCVWAGYGGWAKGDEPKNKANIANQVRMVPGASYSSGWYAGSGGGSAAWESVTGFWNYATGNNTYGPKATGHNNNYPYFGLTPANLGVGHVLQPKRGSSSTYGHSVIIVTKNGDGADFSKWLVAQHSGFWDNRNLWTLIMDYGGNDCYLRYLVFGSANFAK